MDKEKIEQAFSTLAILKKDDNGKRIDFQEIANCLKSRWDTDHISNQIEHMKNNIDLLYLIRDYFFNDLKIDVDNSEIKEKIKREIDNY